MSEPLPEHAPVATGHPDVDAAVAALDGVEQRPLEEQVTAFEAVHETLRAVLADAGDTPADASR